MTPWQKPKPELVERFHELVAGVEGLELRKMFGYPAGFIGGNMAVCLFGDTTIVRLSEDGRRERLDAGWEQFEPMPGRTMREYVALPESAGADTDESRRWVETSAEYVRTLPPKAPKPSR